MNAIVWSCSCFLLMMSQTVAQLAKFEPPAGKMYYGVGQPPFGIQEYLAAEVARLAESELGQGDHIFAWRADGQSSGVYLCRMETPSGILHRLMVLSKEANL
jgi:hypothetical protein